MEAQFERFANTGLTWDHVDGHQHFHMHPTVFKFLLELCDEYGAHRLRVPQEDVRAHLRGGGDGFSPVTVGAWILQTLCKRNRKTLLLRKTLGGKPIFLCDQVYGDFQSGNMHRDYVLKTLDRLEGDGQVVFREHSRKVSGRGWVPPHPVGDTVPVFVQTESVERVVDSAVAAIVLNFPRRGELLVSATPRDTVALHYREWRGDTLVVRQVRRSGWRDELRTVWRDSQLVSATLIEPGNVTQAAGQSRRQFRVERGFLRDAGSRDSVVATPAHPWAIALDGFEDALVPALLAVRADSQPHRFSMYGLQGDRGSWLDWSVTIVPRGTVRVARFYTLQQKWVGSFIFTPTGELLFANLGGAQGVTRVPASGTRLSALLEAQQGKIQREDLLPPP